MPEFKAEKTFSFTITLNEEEAREIHKYLGSLGVSENNTSYEIYQALGKALRGE